MHTNLRRVGGSVMLAVSPVFLKELQIACGSTVDVALWKGNWSYDLLLSLNMHSLIY